MGSRDCRVYVGNLPPDVRTKDVEDLFVKYGKIMFVDLKNRKGPPFAFVEYDDPRDAEDAVRSRDGYDFDGYRLRVEFPRGAGPRGPGGRPLYDDRGYRYGGRGSRGSDRQRRTNYRVHVSGLPSSGSWQDLKDHMREAGDVCYADVFRDGTGIVEYVRSEDMKYAIRKLDDTKFKSHEGETSYVRVREADDVGRDRSRSPVGRRGSPHFPWLGDLEACVETGQDWDERRRGMRTHARGLLVDEEERGAPIKVYFIDLGRYLSPLALGKESDRFWGFQREIGGHLKNFPGLPPRAARRIPLSYPPVGIFNTNFAPPFATSLLALSGFAMENVPMPNGIGMAPGGFMTPGMNFEGLRILLMGTSSPNVLQILALWR
ncbi:hypothetical protein QR680_012697 [Steinernema hermaphroditum]|uniref:RRM domain-containing protein n=1 Tax=Steinernema hermaphroditum TaxID=289476 RepID=A0AA39M169_9BILA|nr:hypothetical protein QR680_012697 [Steinernema hermaphroditum]